MHVIFVINQTVVYLHYETHIFQTFQCSCYLNGCRLDLFWKLIIECQYSFYFLWQTSKQYSIMVNFNQGVLTQILTTEEVWFSFMIFLFWRKYWKLRNQYQVLTVAKYHRPCWHIYSPCTQQTKAFSCKRHTNGDREHVD